MCSSALSLREKVIYFVYLYKLGFDRTTAPVRTGTSKLDRFVPLRTSAHSVRSTENQ